MGVCVWCVRCRHTHRRISCARPVRVMCCLGKWHILGGETVFEMPLLQYPPSIHSDTAVSRPPQTPLGPPTWWRRVACCCCVCDSFFDKLHTPHKTPRAQTVFAYTAFYPMSCVYIVARFMAATYGQHDDCTPVCQPSRHPLFPPVSSPCQTNASRDSERE